MSWEEILIKDRMDRGSPQMNGWKQGNSGKDSRNNRRGKRIVNRSFRFYPVAHQTSEGRGPLAQRGTHSGGRHAEGGFRGRSAVFRRSGEEQEGQAGTKEREEENAGEEQQRSTRQRSTAAGCGCDQRCRLLMYWEEILIKDRMDRGSPRLQGGKMREWWIHPAWI
jgi:hypothetical protein